MNALHEDVLANPCRCTKPEVAAARHPSLCRAELPVSLSNWQDNDSYDDAFCATEGPWHEPRELHLHLNRQSTLILHVY